MPLVSVNRLRQHYINKGTYTFMLHTKVKKLEPVEITDSCLSCIELKPCLISRCFIRIIFSLLFCISWSFHVI